MSETDKSSQNQEQVVETKKEQVATVSELQSPKENLRRMSGGMIITNCLNKEKYEEFLKKQEELKKDEE